MNDNIPAMKPQPAREAALFQSAARLSAAERAMLLDEACHGDPDLRQRLDTRLTAHEKLPPNWPE